MDVYSHISSKKNGRIILTAVVFGIVVNFVLYFVMHMAKLPIYLDTIGTMSVAGAGGSIPGILTAVITNTICMTFDGNAIYYGCINAIIAMWTAWFVRNRSFRKVKDICLFVVVSGIISGGLGSLIQWWLHGDAENSSVISILDSMRLTEGTPRFFVFLGINILLNAFDKGLSFACAKFGLKLIPENALNKLKLCTWRQRPLSKNERKNLKQLDKNTGFSLKRRMTVTLVGMSFVLVIITGAVGMKAISMINNTSGSGDVPIVDFIVRVIIIMLGYFILVVAYGLWISDTYMAYPVSTMVMVVDDFISAGSDQAKQDEAVKKIRRLDIHTGDEVEKLYHSICDLALNQTEQMRSLRRFGENNAKMQNGLIITMADLVENRDSDTGAHIQKTAAYVKIIVEGLYKKGYYAEKVTPKFINDVVTSAPLHDIGKINVPDSVLNKPGKLNADEFEIIKTHTTAGKKIIEKAIYTVEGENYLKEARNMAAYHHERWDGKGYPENLHGEVIPLSARIMAVADVFDALTSPRVYKPAFPLDEALNMIKEGSGTQFDPKCVEVFMDSLSEVKVVLKKYNSNTFEGGRL